MARRLLEPLVRGIPGRAACLVGLGLIAGCSPQTVSTRLVVNTGEATEAQVAETAKVLLARLNDWTSPSFNKTVTASIEGSRIHFDFLGDSPPVADLVYLATTQGVFRMASSDAPGIIWISDLDFAGLQCGKENDHFFIDARITPAAADRMLELTKRNIGKTMVTTLDGKVINRAIIRGPFGERFRVTASADEHVRQTCGILRTGRLPVPIAGYEFESSSTHVDTHPGST